MVSSHYVGARKGKVVRFPATVYTTDLHHCLAVVLYSPSTSVIALAHVFDGGPERYSAHRVIPSLLEDMVQVDQNASTPPLRAHLVGELSASLALPGNRTELITAALQVQGIPIINQVIGGSLWRNVSVSASPPCLCITEFRENCEQIYGEFHPEREYQLVL